MLQEILYFVERIAKINILNRFQLEFVGCENVKHGITSELLFCLNTHLQLDCSTIKSAQKLARRFALGCFCLYMNNLFQDQGVRDCEFEETDRNPLRVSEQIYTMVSLFSN